MVAKLLVSASRTIGFDTSDAFLAAAAERAPHGVEYRHHDARLLPLPEAPADLIYCRLLLAHLSDPAAVVEGWCSQLAAGGRLAVDEVEWIETGHPVLAAYEQLVVELVASRGGPMYAGPIVAGLAGGPTWPQAASILQTLEVPTAAAARMYWMNLMTWRHDPFVAARHQPDEIDGLARDLAALTESAADSEICWGLRQVVFERIA